MKHLLRIIEMLLVLLLLKWAATRLPAAVRVSGEYFRQIVSVVISHLFVFLLSNVIVLTLFFNSRNLFQNYLNGTHHVDFCQEFIKTSDGLCPTQYAIQSSSEEIIHHVYQDKQTIFEVTKVKVGSQTSSDIQKSLDQDYIEDRNYCCRQRVEEVSSAAEDVEMVDELSNEEFQRVIEAFIAKQVKFHQQEKLAIVLHGS
ncbi:hypothetical protein CDL12_11578 [Handroanthus impetiginosus]|uniref:DUF4408 domain-containing protein n=1 Tax=Handroanthus impetiginosus TaxID=429701 RepID=A0A2G9HE10_9LAMI|nr:hypothetical protein CDL12_11578 [Handroanthus impetiginosus]